ncbi:alpha/beta hydrolase [Tateyamaria omphalii]|uniref:alpha/beta fold hydrolase n=1 Tax=Tateyamaria omphalii TaxID=299262 RepID=UPI001C992422|nr:alpha/beta hydrolase [Tateyamaria omphalii]MBY5931500.1 alpha/beta hydrolase [Tateyamaria omphalii]
MTSTTLRLSKSGLRVSMRDQGAGAPVVLIHGVGLQSAAWRPQISALAGTCRIIALDMPGHGGSGRLAAGSTVADFVAWLHEAVVELALGPVSIVGHSMGALIAGGFAIEYPHLTTQVALLNGVFCRDAKARSAVEARADAIRDGAITPHAPLARWFGDKPHEQAARDMVAGWLAAMDQVGYATAYSAFAQGDAVYADRYPNISCPFLAMTAADDPNSTPEMSRTMARTVRDGRAVIIPGHRHMVNLTAPELVTDHLLKWLRLGALKEVAQ